MIKVPGDYVSPVRSENPQRLFDQPVSEAPREKPVKTDEEFARWLVMGSEGSLQRERYERAVAAWNRGASEAEVAAIMGVPTPPTREER